MSEPAFEIPPATRNADGEERRVGFELEFGGLDLDTAAEVVRELFGGEQIEESPFRRRVEGTGLGDFAIEVDARLLQEGKYKEPLEYLESAVEAVDFSQLEKPIEKALGWLAEQVVPFEIATPPIALGELERVEPLRQALAARGALGTGSKLRYAMGLHLNPEAPALTAKSILDHLQAFLVLYESLLESSQVDLTRTLMPFINPFPDAYLHLVLDPRYAPPIGTLAADYVAHNPTRNRPLDLLPLFAHLLGREMLEGIPEDEPLSPRPTFHYRLPNCRIDDPSWTIAEEWNRWVAVERLAARPDELARRSAKVVASKRSWWQQTLHTPEEKPGGP